MSVFVWRDGKLVDRDTAPPLAVGKRSNLAMPYAVGDIKEYISPAGTGPITSRSHRREDLKKSGCREVDPSEGPKEPYRDKKYAKRFGKEARQRMRAKGVKAYG
jgi:hypothetical protein